MKGIEKIIAHIEGDADKQAESILAAAKKRCDKILAGYEEKASELYSSKIRDGVKSCQDKEDGALRISRMEARKSVLAVKQEMVAKSFDLAREKIVSLPADQYVAFLADLVEKAGVSGNEEIILSARDRGAIGDALLAALNAGGKNLKLSDEVRDIAGGLILRSGNVETNCSVDLLMEMCRGELAGKVADVLFG